MIQKVKEWSGVVALVAILLFLGSDYTNKTNLGAVTTTCQGTTTCLTDLFVTGEELQGSATVGYSGTLNEGNVTRTGTTFTRLNGGTCYIKAYATTIAASSTAQVDCQATAAVSANGIAALTGVTFGDSVIATLATSTAGTASNGLVITGASASSTAGYVTLYISNLTGTTFTWPVTGTATGTVHYFVMR